MTVHESNETFSGVIHSNQLRFSHLLLEVFASETMIFLLHYRYLFSWCG